MVYRQLTFGLPRTRLGNAQASLALRSLLRQLSGKVGQLIYRQTKYGTVVYEAPSKASIPQRTEAQMQIRTQWGNMAAVYRQFNQTLKKGLASPSSFAPRQCSSELGPALGLASVRGAERQDERLQRVYPGEHERGEGVCAQERAAEPTNEARAEAKLAWTMPCKEEETRSVT